MAQMSKEKLERRLVREARSVIRETEKVLKKHGHDLPTSLTDNLGGHLEALRAARSEQDGEALRRELEAIDRLSEDHLSEIHRSAAGEYAEAIVIALAIALVLRTFVVEAFKIPSSSMIPTLEIGDHIFVNKILFGLRIPGTDTKFFTFRGPHRGEVVVFKSPCEPGEDFIKRVIAVAGDTVEVRCGIVYVNGEPIDQVLADRSFEYWDRNGPGGPWESEEASIYAETTNGKTYHTVHNVMRPESDAERAGHGDATYEELRGALDFPMHNPPDFRCQGPDQRTDEIIAEGQSRVEPSIPEKTVHAGVCGPQMRYVVPDGYFFAMGDNREHSSDSRVWGPVPLEYLRGKALFIWASWADHPGDEGVPFLGTRLRLERSGEIIY
ncbi:MAG TPA: signal peptidase I [Kofleriaceae bacterium]|nr:signal peptidase I [Kofleriaceae bacterium]